MDLFFVDVTGAAIGLVVLLRRLQKDDNWKSYTGYSRGTAIIAFANSAAILIWETSYSKTLATRGLLAPRAGPLQRIFAGMFLMWIGIRAVYLPHISSRERNIDTRAG